MKRLSIAAVLAASVFGAVLPGHAAQREEPVAVIVDGLAPDVAREVKRRAAEGKTVLLQYLDRGRFVYEVRTPKVIVKEGPVVQPVSQKGKAR